MTAINQKEYLKKYLSLGNEPGKKKKRKKKASTSEKVKIIDDDIDIVTFNQAVEEDLLALNEDAPQIVGVIDDRPLELRIGDYRNTGLWKPVGDETTPFQGGDSPNKVTSQRSLPRDEAPSISDRYNDDYSPPRRRNRSSSPKYKRGSPSRSDDKGRKGYDRESPRSSRRSPVRRNTSDRSPQTPSKRRYDEVDRGRSSPFRKRRRDRDESPIRKGRRSSEDASPPRNRKDWDSSSSRRNRRDQSPGGRDRKYGDANSSGRNRRNFDISPRRKSRFDNFVSPAGRNRQDSARRSPIDRSPVRRNMRNSDVSPIQRNRRDDDASPIRRNTKGGDGSPLRRNRRDDDTSPIRSNMKGGGASPFRRSRRDDDGSPIRSNMKGGAASPLGRSRRDSDTSPIQRNKTGASSIGRNRRDSDTSPPRSSRRDGASFTKKNRWNSDVSPPRRNRNDASPFTKNRRDSDTSPPRRNRTDSDVGGSHAQSPKWRVADRNPSRVNTERDVSPPRRNRTDREDSNPRYTRLSPPRSYRRASDASRGRSQDERSQSGEASRYRPEKSDKPKSISEKDLHEQKIKALSKSRWDQESPRKDSPEVAQPPLLPPLPQFPKKSGLQRANDIIMGKDPSFQPSSDFASLAGFSGGNAAPIVRDRKTGKIRDFEKEEEEAKQKRERDDEMTAKYARWGKGLKQVEDATDKLNSDLHEMTKPLARYADDEDLERHLKEVEREGDPMLAYLRKKKRKQDVEAGKPMKPEFQGEFMPNRYAIRPGHRWDGVDRSNGYEKKWFEMINSRRAQQEESYKWSTEDM